MRKHGVYYDSRIKLLLILLTSALAFALGGGLTGLLLFGVVCLFALLSGLWKTSIKVAIVYIVLLMLAQVLPIHLSSVITFFLLRILTIALALNILFQTTEISELIAALQASHIPQAIVIPVAIILRFLPSLKQDVLYIKQGMKTRGVGLSFWRIVSHPAQTYEGFLVPILMRLLMTATELSASAETRGISYPCEKTHYILVDFRLRDLVEMLHFEETKRKLHKDIPSPKRTDFLSYQQFPILLFSWLFVSPYLPGSFPFQSGTLPALPVFLPLPVSFLPVQPLPPMIGSPALLI